jgi:UDP-N-acetylmuramoyl-tripeptide--D-alanyl-D-alanine ligase
VGSYNFSNVAAAIAFGRYFKLSDRAIKQGIESYVPQNNRSELLQWGSNMVLLDAYNANPSSMAAAIDNIVAMNNYAKKVVVLGDMFELGDYAAEEHQRIVDMLLSHSWERVYLVGKNFACTKSVYPKYETFESFYEAFQKENFSDCLILIKGSRGMAMERTIN